jgi:hypothetical protein
MKPILAFAVLLLGGCAAAPEVRLSPQERIGFLVVLSDSPAHRDGGRTMYSKEMDRKYPFDWKLTQRTSERMAKKLASSRFVAVDLKEHGFTLADLAGLVIKDKTWTPNPAKQAAYERLRKELNLRTVLVFSSPADKRMLNNCVGMYCTYSDRLTTGLFTAVGRPAYMAIADVRADVYVLDPPVNLAATELELQRAHRFTVSSVPDFKARDIQAISEDEWKPIQAAVERSIDVLTDAAIEELLARTK